MNEWVEQAVEINELHYAYKLWGEKGGQPVIALHGWLDNAGSFDRLAPLMTGCQIAAIDMAGHGLSGHRHPQAHYNLWDDLLDILAIADHLGWEKFVLLGHSRGALISLLLAGSLPERISALLLLDGIWPLPVPAEEAPKQLRRYLKDCRKLPGKRVPVYESSQAALEARCKSSGLSGQAAGDLLARGLVQTAKGFLWRTDPKLTAASAFKLSEAHSEAFTLALSMPTLLCLASEGFGAYPDIEQRLARFPRIDVHKINGGHHCHMENAVLEVAALINAFIAGRVD